MQNYPPSGGAPNYAPSGMPQGQPPKSKKGWIIGGLIGCVLLIIIVAALGGIGYFVSRNLQSTQSTNAPAPRQAPNTRQYVNTREGRTGKLSENFVDFSFYYPDDWELNDDGTELLFVSVERNLVEAGEKYPQEKIAVGWVSATGTARDKQLMPKLAAEFGEQLASQYPSNYKKVSEGETRIGPYAGYEFRFVLSNNKDELCGRFVLLPPPAGQTKGVVLVMAASKRVPGVTGVADVGEQGELPVILNSFRFGSGAAK